MELAYRLCQWLTVGPLLPFSRIYYEGTENVPSTGPALLIANHVSHFDPPLLSWKFPRIIHYMADKPITELPIMGPLMKSGHVFPIDRTKTDRAAMRTAMARLEGDNVVGIFPEKGIRHGKTSVLGGAELAIGTASLWKMMDVPVIPAVIIGSDQMYAVKKYLTRPRIFMRIGKTLAADKEASREELRDRIAASWRELYEGMLRDHKIRPEELPQSAQERWGQPAPAELPVED
jgi:1-acyl-sn-glycerol-3-phosphate acyltransferase